MKTLLPTSTAGSLPKPTWLAQPETLWSPWKLQNEELVLGKRDALRLSLDDQLRAGIDIVSDGEQTRQHFVTTFIEHLSGVDFENRQTVTHPQPLRRQRADRGQTPWRASSRCLLTTLNTCASSPTSRSNGPCPAR